MAASTERGWLRSGHSRSGVPFRDITPLLSDGAAFSAAIESLTDRFRGKVDAIAGIEVHGFIVAAPMAVALGCALISVRKAGKLPPPVQGADYELEYGSARVEIAAGSVPVGCRVTIVDDVLATGGTAAAAGQLVHAAGGLITRYGFLIELDDLDGRSALSGAPVHTLAHFSGGKENN